MNMVPLAFFLASGFAGASCTQTVRVGVVQYEIRETARAQVISRGRAEPTRTEIDEWKAHDGTTHRTKRISLDEHFVIELDSSEDHSSLTGFAMSLERTDVRTFSWEWFDMVSEHDARKLQGQGELFVQVDEAGGQVVKTRFLSDVVFRTDLFPDKEDRLPAELRAPAWTATIFKGSYIDWGRE